MSVAVSDHELNDLREQLARTESDADEMCKENCRLRARIDALEEAVRPFAAMYEDRENLSWPGRIEGEPLDDDDSAECAVNLGDLRRAARALAGEPPATPTG